MLKATAFATFLAAIICLQDANGYISLPRSLVRVGQRKTLQSRAALAMSTDTKRKVVVTGLGTVSGNGIGVEKFWNSILEGECSINRVENFDPEGYATQVASEVKDFEPKDYFSTPKNVRSNDPYTHFAVGAARLALEDAQLDTSKIDATKFGVMIGSAMGGVKTYEEQMLKLDKSGPGRVSPFLIPAFLGNTASGIVGIEVGAKGPNFGIVSACAAATHCIGEAMQAIQTGQADMMLAGGSEAGITPLSFAGFCSMNAMAKNFNDQPKKASRPFDSDRCGFVMAEGAGVILIESEEHAIKRGAKIYCELAGYGASCDAHHITTPQPEGAGLAQALEMALESAGVDKSDVTYVNAHGTSTAYNDKFETLALKRVFGEEGAKKLKISSTKGITGHALGAAGGYEAVACVKAIETGWVPPTINYETPDPDCDLDYVPNEKQNLGDVKVAVSNNLGFGGHNGVILFKK